MKNLAQVEAALRGPNPDHDAITAALERLGEECRIIKYGATIALQGVFTRDLRPAALAYVRGLARVHGRTTAEQVQACMHDRDPWFSDLAMVAWGLLL